MMFYVVFMICFNIIKYFILEINLIVIDCELVVDWIGLVVIYWYFLGFVDVLLFMVSDGVFMFFFEYLVFFVVFRFLLLNS